MTAKWTAIGYESKHIYAQGEKSDVIRTINQAYPYHYKQEGKKTADTHGHLLPEPIRIVSRIEALRMKRQERHEKRIKQVIQKKGQVWNAVGVAQ